MAVDTADLSKPVLQNIETWTSAQNHDLGYRTEDRTTGHAYRYVKLADTTFLPAAGQPVGWNGASSSTDGTLTLNEITGDASTCGIGEPGIQVAGVCRGSTSSTNIYGFIEEKRSGFCTTVLSCYDSSIDVGDALVWSEDGMLSSATAAAISSYGSLLTSLVGFAVDSHGSKVAQGSTAAISSITTLGIVWA